MRCYGGVAPSTALAVNAVLYGHSQTTGLGTRVASARPDATITESEHDNASFATGGFYSLTANFTSQVHAHFASGEDNRVYVICGLVDINDLGRTGATCYADLLDFIEVAQAAGWRVFIVTICATTEYTASDPHPDRGDLQPERDDYNDRVVAGLGGAGGDGVVRWDLVPELSDATDTDYFEAPGIAHFTSAGKDAAANAIAATI